MNTTNTDNEKYSTIKKINRGRIVTPVGKAYWAYLDKPEEFNGQPTNNYSIQVEFTKEGTQALKSELLRVLEEAKQAPKFSGKQWKKEPNISLKEGKDNSVRFKFASKVSYIDHTTHEEKPINIQLFNSKGDKLKPSDTPIPVGNKVRICFKPVPYHINRNNNGIRLQLEALLLLEEATNEDTNYPSASSYGLTD